MARIPADHSFIPRAVKRALSRIRQLTLSDQAYLEKAYRKILGRPIDPEGLSYFLADLKAGRERLDVVCSLLRSEEFFKKIIDERTTPDHNRAFLKRAYQKIIGREIDEEGIERYSRMLEAGWEMRWEFLIELTRSDEFINRVLRENMGLKEILRFKPDQYRKAVNFLTSEPLLTLNLIGPEDFDWLELTIQNTGYYERPGIWSYSLDEDKQLMAEMMAGFGPKRVLELGCSNGSVLKLLADRGIEVEGVEISSMAIRRAFPEIRDRIHEGDLLSLELDSRLDLIFGLDIFEHLNPNKFDRYLRILFDRLNDGGTLFCNIPAFGPDPMFGTLFPLYLKDWEEDARKGELFKTLPVDDRGYPKHGHLIWADTHWWVERFESQGFRREKAVERELHRQFDRRMEGKTPARMAYYVFSKSAKNRQALLLAE